MIVVINRSRTVSLDTGRRLRCGRHDDVDAGVIGLDALDRSISRRALEVEHTLAGWTLVNVGSYRPWYVERTAGGPLVALPPGGRHIIDRHTTSAELRAEIRTHRLEFLLAETEHASHGAPVPIRGADTISGTVSLTDAEREALAALFRSYLVDFPRRECEPASYADAAALLGVSTTSVRRRVERVRARIRRSGTYIDGPHAKHHLAAYLLDRGLLTTADLPARGTT